MFGNSCRAIGLGSGEMSWLRSIALRTLLRIEELVWRLDRRVGFCNSFKKRAHHIVQPKLALVAVTTSAWHRCCRCWPLVRTAKLAAPPLLRLCMHAARGPLHWSSRPLPCPGCATLLYWHDARAPAPAAITPARIHPRVGPTLLA